MTPFGDERTQVRTVWLLCCFVVVIGITSVWWPSSQKLNATRTRANELYEEANHNEAELKRGAELVAARASLLADVANLRGQGSGTAATAVALGSLSGEAKSFQVEVRSVVPQPGASSAGGLGRTELALVVRGHFRNIVAFVSDLPRHASLIGVDGITFGVDTSSPADTSMLDATIHASLYHLQNDAGKEQTHASGAS